MRNVQSINPQNPESRNFPMKTEQQKRYILAACRMAARSQGYSFQSKLQASFEGAKEYMQRSYRAQRASLRLLQLGGAIQ